MSDEPVPRLRVVDGGGGREALPTPEAAASAVAADKAAAEEASPPKKKRLGWVGVLVFLAGAIAGGAAVPMLLGQSGR